jgi:hypothetical protein
MDVFVSCVAQAYTTLQGHAQKVHVQQERAPARVVKKKVEAPKYKLIWQRKEVQPPRAISSRAGREGGRVD